MKRLDSVRVLKDYLFLPQFGFTTKVQLLPFMIILQAHVFQSKSGCAAFLANYNPSSYAKVSFRNMHYNLPPWSISILPDCKNTVYNTARVSERFLVNLKICPSILACCHKIVLI